MIFDGMGLVDQSWLGGQSPLLSTTNIYKQQKDFTFTSLNSPTNLFLREKCQQVAISDYFHCLWNNLTPH